MFKYGLREFQRNIFTNLLVILQLAVTLVLTVAMISAVVDRIKLYLPLKPYLEQHGQTVLFSGMNQQTHMGITEEDVQDASKFVTDVFAPTTPSFINNSAEAQYISYSQALLDAYTPAMSDGVWIDKTEFNKEDVSVVVTDGSPYQVGDELKLRYTVDSGTEVTEEMIANGDYGTKNITATAKVIGVIAKNEYLYGISELSASADYRDFYISTSDLADGSYCMIFNKEELNNWGVPQIVHGVGVFAYTKGKTEEQETALQTMFAPLLGGTTISNDNVRQASERYVYQQLYLLLPVILCFLLLIMVSSLSLSAIYTKKQLRNFALYYVCGSRWRNCLVISLINSLMTAGGGVLLAVIALNVAKMTGWLGGTVIAFGGYQFLACVAVIVFQVVISLLMPLQIMRTNTPKQIMTTNE